MIQCCLKDFDVEQRIIHLWRTRRALPAEILSAGSSTEFCQLFRGFIKKSGPHITALAQRYHPDATCFGLDNTTLSAIRIERETKIPKTGKNKGVERIEFKEIELAKVPFACETDLFRAVGLDYVPFHMRQLV